MATLAAEAESRHHKRVTEVRELIAKGETRKALWVALKGVMGEALKVFDRHTGDGMLLMADITGMLLVFASQLHEHRARPRGCPPLPRPEDLLRVLDTSMAREAAGVAQ